MISVNQVSLNFGAFELFKDITFMINARDRIGLVGRNGAGKSTLLKMIAGLQKYDTGVIASNDGITIGYLPQQMIFSEKRTVFEESKLAFSESINLQTEIDYLNKQLETRQDHNSKEYLDLIHRMSDATERYQLLGGSSIEADIEKTLLGLGFSASDFTRPTTEFSGGWRMRIELAKILLRKPDLFLLDEPTNHLDIESIQWLENYLANYPGAVVLISHDRAFLDNVTNRTIELSLGRTTDYKVSYTKYMELRTERRVQQMAAYRNQQKMMEDTQDFIDRFRSKATKAVQVQSRIKQLARIDVIEIDPEDTSSINIRFPSPIKSGKLVVEIKGLGKCYGPKAIIENIDLVVESGQRIAFVGKNGEGKSTLSKIIVGDLDHTGHLKIGHNVKVGYFAQNQDELMDENQTVFDTIDKVAVGDIRTKIRDILGAFLFGGEDVDKKVKVLSGGERSRLAIAKLMLEPYNLLVLDEPTNHLDMRSKDVLKQALLKYEGTLIMVSHDRDFLDGLVDRVYEFTNMRIKEHLGGIYDFMKTKKIDSFKEIERKTDPQPQVQTKTQQTKENDKKTIIEVKKQTPSKVNYTDRKEQEKLVRKAANKVKESEQKIENLEKSIKETDDIIANPELFAKIEDTVLFFKKYEDQKRQLDIEMAYWEQYQMELEELKN